MKIFYLFSLAILSSTVSFAANTNMNGSQVGNAVVTGSQYYESGCNWLSLKEYQEALYHFQLAADFGHIEAQFKLGQIYEMGCPGVHKNLEEAFKWFKKAADQGEPKAQYFVAGMYFRGDGVERNFSECLRYFILAANQGHLKAKSGLGYVYYNGLDSEKDIASAWDWNQKAADEGSKDGHTQLATMYFDVQEEAHKLYLDAKKNTQSKKRLEEIRNTEAYLKDGMENRKYAGYWLKLIDTNPKKLNENGNKFSNKNPEYALDCYAEAASKGFKNAKNTIQKLQQSDEYRKFTEHLLSDDEIIIKDNKIEWFLARRDYPARIIDAQKQNKQPNWNNKKDFENQKEKNSSRKDEARNEEEPKININKQLEKKSEAGNDKNNNRAVICNNTPIVAKEELEININNQLQMGGETDYTKNIHKPLINTNDAAIAAEERGTKKAHNQDVDMPVIDTTTCDEKKIKKTLRVPNPLKKVNQYLRYKKETKEEKEERKRERNKSKVLGNLVDNSERSYVSKSFADSLVSKSHFSITESEFDNEESFVSQSEGPMDDIKKYIKNIYPQLFRLIKKSKVEHLDQVKIPSSNLIRAILKILQEQKLIDGTISRDKIHVNKVGQQDEVFFSHTTHGSGNYTKWYHNPEVVVKFFTFISNSDPKIKSYLFSEFGIHGFLSKLEIDDSNGPVVPR